MLYLRYSQLNPLCFSLAYTGVLVQRRNSQQQQSSKCEVVSERDSSHSGLRNYVMAAHKDRNKKEGEGNDTLSEIFIYNNI